MEIVINRMREDHWKRVKQIYEDGIATGNATFEQKHLLGRNGIKDI